MAIAIAMIAMSATSPCRMIDLIVVLVYIDTIGEYWQNAAIKYPFAEYGSMQDQCDLGMIDDTGDKSI